MTDHRVAYFGVERPVDGATVSTKPEKLVTLTVDATAGAVQVVAGEVLHRVVGVTQGALTELTLGQSEAKAVAAELRARGYEVSDTCEHPEVRRDPITNVRTCKSCGDNLPRPE